MRVTVCQLRNEAGDLAQDWDRLVAHVGQEGSDLVLLPEMPFYPWVAWTRQFDPAVWLASVKAHDAWMQRLTELAPAVVLGSRPVIRGGRHLNEGFLWEAGAGYRAVHAKYYLPDEPGFWEASWYERGDSEFIATQCGEVKVGYMICTEIWFAEHARSYGKEGAHLLLCPRGTPMSSADKWVAGGRTAAVVSGAYCLSSNRGGVDAQGMEWAGTGWIVEPEEGEVLGLTSVEQPFLTREIDLKVADRAKETYPRYVLE
jgi:N-carbamoylputrescine amidase